MQAVFRHGKDAVSKNLDAVSGSGFALSGKVFFFGSLLLGRQKK